LDWSRLGQCSAKARDHYGLGAATAVSGALAMPIPKRAVPPYRVIGSKTTNPLSLLGHFAEVNVPRVKIGTLGSTNLLRIAGALTPNVAAAMLALDAGVIGHDTHACYDGGGG
jgi:hypothetical protein